VTPGTAVQVADYPRASTFGPRRLIDYEFVWVLRGSAIWTRHEPGSDGLPAREHRLVLAPGELALARAGTVDSYQWNDQTSSTHAYVHFRMRGGERLGGEHAWPATRSMLDVPILGAVCGYLLDLAGQQSDRARARSDELVGLLVDLFVTGPFEEPVLLLPGWLVSLTGHVRRVWDADGMRMVEVPELAQAAAVSTGHLYRLFRSRFGCGPAHALELLRLARAASLLRRSNATLSEVAAQTGFANAYHFSRRFAGAYATPPGAYRHTEEPADPLAPVRLAGLLPMAQLVLRSRGPRSG